MFDRPKIQIEFSTFLKCLAFGESLGEQIDGVSHIAVERPGEVIDYQIWQSEFLHPQRDRPYVFVIVVGHG